MATAVVRDLADTIIGNDDVEESASDASVETIIKARDSQIPLVSSSSYLLSADGSLFSRDVDQWMRGDSLNDAGVQRSRVTTVQRSTIATSSSLNTGLWYLAAIVLPFLSANNPTLRRCTPSTMLSTVEMLIAQMAYLCGQCKTQLRRLANEQAARDLFATAMDIVLVIYAMGFLVLSLYQASVIG